MYERYEELEKVPPLFDRYFDQSQLSHKPRAHPFGLQIKYFQAKRNLTLQDISEASGVSISDISRMCNGKRLGGNRARDNILRIINGLRLLGVLEYRTEANELLDAAGRHLLENVNGEADIYLWSRLKSV